MKGYKIILCIFLLHIVYNGDCQEIPDPLRYYNPIPASPNVAGLGKYGDFPVGLIYYSPFLGQKS
jgi:hypothetical protein